MCVHCTYSKHLTTLCHRRVALRTTETLKVLAPRPSLCSCVHSCDTLDMLRLFGSRRPVPCFRAPDDKYTNSLKVASCGKDCLRSHQLSSSFHWCRGHSDKEETSTCGESFFLFLSAVQSSVPTSEALLPRRSSRHPYLRPHSRFIPYRGPAL